MLTFEPTWWLVVLAWLFVVGVAFVDWLYWAEYSGNHDTRGPWKSLSLPMIVQALILIGLFFVSLLGALFFVIAADSLGLLTEGGLKIVMAIGWIMTGAALIWLWDKLVEY